MQTYQNIIIGFGKGGKTLAKQLAQQGEKTLLIEKSPQMYGGTCINVGCIPSKSLITQAEKHYDFTTAMMNKNNLISNLRDKNFHMLADDSNIDVWTATAKFKNNDTLIATFLNGDATEVTGQRIFINTGATPVIPPIQGAKVTSRILTSEEVLAQHHRPESLTIIGSGYIGLEFASMYAQFGTKVTIIDRHESFIPREDQEIAAIIKNDLENSGIEFKLGVQNLQLQETANKVSVVFNDNEVIESELVLLATGRKPNTQNLGLENTDIQLADNGAIIVDSYLKTTVPNIWAIGDVKGGLQFTYISLDDSKIIADQLFGNSQRTIDNRPIVPYTVFLTPTLSVVGINEDQAKQQQLNYKVFKLPVANIPKANILGDSRGLFKVIVDKNTQYILGATLYGVESQELINIITLAMQMQIPYTVLKNQIYTHPTMTEALNDLFK